MDRSEGQIVEFNFSSYLVLRESSSGKTRFAVGSIDGVLLEALQIFNWNVNAKTVSREMMFD